MLEKLEAQFTKYEIARILGARALQVAMDAPLLLKIDEKELEEINYNPIEIAKRELAADVLPITVNKPMPKKKETKIKKLTKEELEEIKKKEKELADSEEAKIKAKEADKKVEAEEEKEEKEISADGEIMELSNPEDETEEAGEAPAEEGI
ncbi:MAG: DNA-directed RNA polymerase subunit K [Nanoarchaeota archaeon]